MFMIKDVKEDCSAVKCTICTHYYRMACIIRKFQDASYTQSKNGVEWMKDVYYIFTFFLYAIHVI